MMSKEIIERLTKRIRHLEHNERSEVTNGVFSVLFVDLPVAGQTGRLRFVTNGRKPGEGPGAGTGVLVSDDGVAWRLGDGTTVLV